MLNERAWSASFNTSRTICPSGARKPRCGAAHRPRKDPYRTRAHELRGVCDHVIRHVAADPVADGERSHAARLASGRVRTARGVEARFHSNTAALQLHNDPISTFRACHSRSGPNCPSDPTHCSVKYSFMSGCAACTAESAESLPRTGARPNRSGSGAPRDRPTPPTRIPSDRSCDPSRRLRRCPDPRAPMPGPRCSLTNSACSGASITMLGSFLRFSGSFCGVIACTPYAVLTHGADVPDEVGGIDGKAVTPERATDKAAIGLHPRRCGPRRGDDPQRRSDGQDFAQQRDDFAIAGGDVEMGEREIVLARGRSSQEKLRSLRSDAPMPRRRKLTPIPSPSGRNNSRNSAARSAAGKRLISSALPPVSEKPKPSMRWKRRSGSTATTGNSGGAARNTGSCSCR